MSAQGPGHDDRGGRGRAGWSGIITDGDLRRLHMRGGSFDAPRPGRWPTRGPRTIGADELAAKALEIMEGKITQPRSWSTRAKGLAASFTYTTSSARRSSSLFVLFLHPKGRDRVVLKLHCAPNA